MSSMYPSLVGSVDALSVALEVRDAYTRSHCDRAVRLATELGNACNVLDAELDQLRVSARFHDIGKIGVPDGVLLKPGKLDADEWKIMMTHPSVGEQIFRSTRLQGNEEIASVIRHHHEAFDGSGYPDGLKGDDIPLLSRILLIVDGYDAMTTARPYSKARSHEQVMGILESEIGKKIDPEIFKTFSRLIEHSPVRAH